MWKGVLEFDFTCTLRQIVNGKKISVQIVKKVEFVATPIKNTFLSIVPLRKGR